MNQPDQMLPVRNPDVIFKSIGGSGILLHSGQEVYFGLNTVGVRVWELLPPACTTLGEVCEVLAAEYPGVDPGILRADVTELLNELREHGLVHVEPPRSDATGNGDPASASA